ncbi:hypothetical protein PMZ80_006321 [Knufia obscura]|uniref:PIG-P domain-containing protein n=2 Tax=Knufia TaxID=430999 RepID=A0AAN8EQ22_9EURO|nr:hypothetical protein PMZ80_006321 [Knufia obscura]KAK5953535.1 hypothetical protein OHC33_005479 [Knufia fluminis]
MPEDDRQSRESTDSTGPGSPTRRLPPTLKPFLDNLPAPASLTRTQTAPVLHRDLIEHDEPTPTRAFFNLPGKERIGSEEDLEDKIENEEEVDEDEEFQSHYSRQSSPATSSDSEGEGEDTILDTSADDLNLSQVQRVSSVPTSAVDHQHALQNHLHMSRSTTALSRGPPPLPPPLYPPFYNKPPTPLPPSPSLTSLLRPPSLLNRSTTSTRPTTPDSSDVETPNDTEAQVAQSARRANPLPPTAPKVPTYEYYGFVLYLASSLAFLMYILWAYLPSPFLHALGITYYPDRWWALAIPAWIVMVLIYIYIALACYNVEYLTLGLNRVETMVDEAGNVAILDDNGRIRKGGSKRYVAELEERRKREAIMATWERRKKGAGGSGRAKKKDGKREEREREDEWYGYTGEVTESGVASGLSWRQIWNEGTDAVMDVPLGGVCEVLYGEGRDVL